MRFFGRDIWRTGLLLLAALIGSSGRGGCVAAFAAESTPGKPMVEIHAETMGDDFDSPIALVCQLNSCLEAAVTIDAKLTNLEPSQPLPYTFVARNEQPEVVLKFTPIRRAERTHINFFTATRCGGIEGEHDTQAVYRLPYPPVKSYNVSQGNLGQVSHAKGSGNEYAIDWNMPAGSLVLAARGGTVIGIKQDSNQGGDDAKFDLAGNQVVVKHADGTCAEYLHLQQDSALVKLGQHVNPGTSLAHSGNTGHTTGPHLHVAVFVNQTGSQRTCLPVHWKTKHGVFERLLEGRTY